MQLAGDVLAGSPLAAHGEEPVAVVVVVAGRGGEYLFVAARDTSLAAVKDARWLVLQSRQVLWEVPE